MNVLVTQQSVPIPSPAELEYQPSPQQVFPLHVQEMLDFAKTQVGNGKSGEEFQTPGFDADSQLLADIKQGATSWRALEIIYNYYERYRDRDDHSAELWIGTMRNAQAVRNRLKGLKLALRHLLQARAQHSGRGSSENPVRMLSLAAGSAQGVLEVVAELKSEGIYVAVTLIDGDVAVRGLLEQRISALGLDNMVRFHAENAFKFRKITSGQQFDLVEMAGLMDYLQHSFAVSLCRKIQAEALESEGYFLTCHIHENEEVDFMRYVINWGNRPLMLYRNKQDFINILKESGFRIAHSWTEPHEIHTIAVGEKG